MDTVILIPAYKPDMALIRLVEQLNEVGDLDILVVDDGSGSEFAPVFAKLSGMAAFSGYEVNCGKGHALKHGFTAVKDFFPDDEITYEDALHVMMLESSNVTAQALARSVGSCLED